MSQRKKENAKIKSLENKVSQMQLQKKPKRKKRPTPFGDTGSIIGNRIGGMFGRSDIGKGVGRWLGSGIGSIFGSGDYSMTGQQPAYNVLVNGSQVPQFDTTRATNVVCHREYLGDIIGTTSFNNTQYPLNPGISQTFPWLSSIAANYQEFKFHGIIFEFRPLITDYVTSGAPGVVVLATNYNADVVNYTTKQQMENSEFAVSIKPTMPVIHGIECADDQTTIPHRYVPQVLSQLDRTCACMTSEISSLQPNRTPSKILASCGSLIVLSFSSPSSVLMPVRLPQLMLLEHLQQMLTLLAQ